MIEDELTRLARSDALRRAPRHQRLLRYLVEKCLAGDDAALRETAIALDVFRRDPATFDPQTDPIVRVSVGRLRERLEQHYAAFDDPPRLRIVLPKGRYIPEFVADASVPFEPAGVAVLGTRNRTGLPELDGWGAALAERLTDALAHAGMPRVVARASADAAEAAAQDIAAVGHRLGVRWLVEPALDCLPDGSLRAVVRLLTAADASVRWAEEAVRPAVERYALADRIVDRAVARTIASIAARPQRSPLPASAAPLAAGHRAALDSARLLLVRRTTAATAEAVGLAEGLVAERPDVASAWAMLGAALYSRASFQDAAMRPQVDRIREANRRALELDPDEAVALRTEAILVARHDRDPARAEALYARVLRALPHYTSARLNLAETLWLQGRFDEALAETDVALHYDPLSAAARMARAMCLGYMRRHDEARQEWSVFAATGEKSLWGVAGAAMNELYAGRTHAAARVLDAGIAKLPDLAYLEFLRAFVHAGAGDAAAARRCERACLERAPASVLPSQRAALASLLRDKPRALALLEQALAENDIGVLYAGIDPVHEWLAGDADFDALLRQGGIPGWRGVRARAGEA